MEMKFYKCEICGNIVAAVRQSGVRVRCCGEEMKELTANTTDGVFEKHIPVFTVEDDHVYVTVGEKEHPMTDEHFIEWIAIETTGGNQRKELLPGSIPEACFALCKDVSLLSVCAYCNLHGLWRKKVTL